MENEKFWNEANKGGLRGSLADFLDKSNLFSQFKGEKYYQLEDEIIDFIKSNKEIIYREVDKEYQREDIKTELKDIGENAIKVVDNLPLGIIDKMVTAWQDNLSDNDAYFESMWDSLRDVLSSEYDFFTGIDEMNQDEVRLYIAYLKDWFDSHTPPFEYPVCPSEFIDNELTDDDCISYYESIAQQYDL